MIRLTVSVDSADAEEFFESEPVQKAIRAWVPRSAIRAARYLREEIASGTKVQSGQLRNDIGFQTTPTGYEVVARAPHASYMDQGTRPHEIRPRNGKALAFPMAGGRITRSASTGHVRTKFTFGGRSTTTNAVFATRVWHPGVRARHFSRSTANRLESSEPRELEAHIEEALRE